MNDLHSENYKTLRKETENIQVKRYTMLMNEKNQYQYY